MPICSVIKNKRAIMIFKLHYKDDLIYDIELTKQSDNNNGNITYYLELEVCSCLGSAFDLAADLYADDTYSKKEIREEFTYIDDLRGWLWEYEYGFGRNNFKTEKDVSTEYVKTMNKLRVILQAFAEKYKMSYVED